MRPGGLAGWEKSQRHTWASGGGWGGDAPPLASKNLSPPLEPKIRDLKKILTKKRKKCIFLKKSLSFMIFARKDRTLILLKKLLVSYSYFHKNPSFLL